MAFGNDDRKTDRIADLQKLIDKRLGGARAAAAKRFVAQFYAHVGWQDLAEMELDEMYGSALSLWNFAQDHRPGSTLVRVYNPRFEEQGWKADHTIVEIVTDDMPFLVDSGTVLLQAKELAVHLVIHPVVKLKRDKDGAILGIEEADADGADITATSCMHFEVNEQTDPELLADIETSLAAVYSDVRAAVEDWPRMRQAATDEIASLRKSPKGSPAEPEEIAEAADFLQWLHDDHFIFLGYRDYLYPAKGRKGGVDAASGLGVLRDPDRILMRQLRMDGELPEDISRFFTSPELLMVTKAEGPSYVHRAARLDVVGVKQFDKAGNAVGQRLFAGLFTSVAYNRSPSEIPLLRRRVSTILKRAGLRPSSHDGKALVNILETYPRDELFQADLDTLFDTSMGILHLQERQRVALFLRRDGFERFVSCLVYVPRDNYTTDLRKRINAILAKALNGEVTVFYTQIGDSLLARLHVIVKTEPGKLPDYDVQDIEASIVEAARTWTDRLTEALVGGRGEEAGLRLAGRYGAAFPAGYMEKVNAHAAVFDIDKVETVLANGGIEMNLYRPIEARPEEIRFKLYHPDSAVPLSMVMPMLENMGLRVIDEEPTDVRPGDRKVMIHDFGLVTRNAAAVELSAVREKFHAAFQMLWSDEIENDGFNRLVLAGLDPRDVSILRGYAKFLRQAGIAYSQAYMEETLGNHANIAGLLIQLFRARFDPAAGADRKKTCQALVKKIVGELNDVTNADEDRMLGRFLNCVTSTLRTNYFQTAAGGGPKPALSFKFDSKALTDLPQPAPLREIFVYSPRLEAVHLRFGLVARGGLRWSDRREDFRTEILGLVKAQQVKNAVIVPVGSKGGFVLKRLPKEGGREAFMEEGIACYRIFLRSMLDITDNLSGSDIVPPADVVRWDGDDPYLVVAADKGTATFSDYANAVSEEYGFWLGDAFASGGSQGYDHKKMGITARGAWESVKRHFREMGTDCQTEPFTCVGVGDMAGDVFGNGMLNSKATKLVGAFNHMHIFIDPEPDIAKSYEERKRMFDLPRSSWTDYNTKLISKGGGVFERSAKSIKLSPEIRRLFGIEAAELAPNDLIRAMLKADVDLLWFGGIGTYIKASHESQGDAGDRANDALRINGDDVRARVIGEGANLGTTQLGRIEAAMKGVRLNTDSIDNSAGVDCSDHEVNIKILLGGVVADGDMTLKQRNKLLAEMTDEVGDLVLRDNYLQSQAISLVEHGGAASLHPQRQLMRMLERLGRLNRSIEYLPDDEEIRERQLMHTGLTRPEISILMPYAKIWLYDELLASDLPDDPQLEEDLVRYFPTALRSRYKDQIGRHRLRREIITTVVTNSMINRVGGWFPAEIAERTGMSVVDIARAYTITRDVFALRDVWGQIEALDNKVSADLQIRMLEWINKLISGGVLWFLRNGPHPLDISSNMKTYAKGVAEIAAKLDDFVLGDVREILNRRAEKMISDKVPEGLARRVANMSIMVTACDICRIAAASGKQVADVGELYFKVGDRFGLDWIRIASDAVEGDDHWERLAVSAIVEDFYSHQGAITAAILQAANGGSTDAAIETWIAGNRIAIDRTEQLLTEIRSLPGDVDLAMLAVVNRQFRAMSGQ